MRKILMALCSGTLLLTTSTAFATNFPEIEPNDTKAASTVVAGMVSGDTLSGTTTGTSTTVAGPGSADSYKISTAAAALGVYRHRLVITTGGTAGHSGYIMGTAAAGAASEITACQASSTTSTVARSNQWYGFGRSEQIYYRVTGTTSTTGAYTSTLTDTTIVPTAVAGVVTPGSVTITTVGQGHTTDTEIALYDGGFNILRWNDDEPSPGTTLQSKIVQTLSPGTYYLAVTRFNMFIQQALEANDRDTTGNRLDFADGIGSSSSSTTASNMAFAITSGAGTVTQAAAIAESYEVKWYSFVVSDPTGACCFSDGSCTEVSASACITAGGTPQAGGTTCSPNPCPQPQACCFTNGNCTVQLPAACSAAGGTAQGNGTNCSPNPCPQPQGCCLPSGVCFVALPAACSTAGGNPTGNPDCGTVHTYSSSPGTVIADSTTWGPDTIAIGDTYYVGDVNVTVDIRHTFLGDLNITIGHGATNVQIWSGDCGGNDNLNATADDQAANIVCATPTTASWNPNSATAGQFLSAFAGAPVTGNWTISGADTAGGDTGVLNSWTLTIGEYCLPVTPVRCCFGDGSCQDLLASACTTAGGTPDALGTSCPGTPACVDFRQACCFGDTSCTLVLPAACTTAGGTPQGVGSVCASVVCPDLNPGQSCNNPIPVDVPGALPYSDANTTCGKINDYSNTCLGSYDSGEDIIYRLDVSDPVCLTITLDGSVAGGSIWLGMGLDDTCPLGAVAGDCIALGTTSAAIDTINVQLNAGTYYLMVDTFASPNCAAYTLTINECPTVACCIAGVCSDLNVPDCTAAGGTSQGAGSACATTAECPNACCFATGACTYVTATACGTAGGLAGAVGSDCTPNDCPQPGRCCLNDGSCQVLLPLDCQAAGGVYSAGNCFSNYIVSTIAPALVDLTTSGTATLLDYGTDDDDGQINVVLPFSFPFYGNAQADLDISTNGYVTFDGNGSDFSNDNPIPNTLTPNEAIYPLWDDFDLDGVDKIYYDTQGSVGNRVFIVEWVNVGQYNSGSPPLDANTFELKLFEADGCIEFHYGTITAEGVAPSTPAGTDYTIGVESAGGATATQIAGASIGTGNTARRLCYDNSICPQPEACCTNGACTFVLASICTAGGGSPQGAGTNCGSVVCPQPDGCLGILVGDANCDGSVNNFDIDYYVQGVLNPTAALPPDVPPTATAAYLASGGTEACWAKRRCWGDINCDGVSNNFDIDAFVACILSTPNPGDPCQQPFVCVPQACCFPGGSCAMIRPAGCILSGGTPQGTGTVCGVVVCP